MTTDGNYKVFIGEELASNYLILLFKTFTGKFLFIIALNIFVKMVARCSEEKKIALKVFETVKNPSGVMFSME